MKKEKEIVLTDEERMKKFFCSRKEFMIVLEGILMVIPIFLIIIALISFFSSKADKGETNVVDSSIELQNDESINWKDEALTILNLKDELYNNEDFQNSSEGLKNLIVISKIISAILGYIIAIFIVDSLARIFKEVEKQGTPFTEKNIKLLKRVQILSIILWIFGNFGLRKNFIGLIFILAISAFTVVFEHGCKLQKEYDETL